MTYVVTHPTARFVVTVLSVWIGASWLAPGMTARGVAASPPVVTASIESLARAMDAFHTRIPVYDDVSSGGNRFHALAKLPNDSALVTISGSHSLDKHSGATAIRATFVPGGINFGGFVFQNGLLPSGHVAPVLNFGTVPNAGHDLTGATSLTFWARGEHGGETVDFFMGGVGWTGSAVNNPCTPTLPGACPFPDSTPAVKITTTLTTAWTQYTIDLAGRDLTSVLGGFGWAVDGALNPAGAAFLLDDIQYNLTPGRRAQRLNEPRFIASFQTLPLQPNVHDADQGDDIDLVLRNAAFVYDNALALLAFLADGSPDSVRRARLIGDALVYASAHDRSFDDGRLRSAYAAGDIALPPGWTPNNRIGTVPVPGYYEDLSVQFSELSEARVVDTGNQAWAMTALLALYHRTGDAQYLAAARVLGNLIHGFRNDAGTYQGFLAGLEYTAGDGVTPVVRQYASTEHNLDVYAAFTTMFGVTGEAVWQADAQHARQFIEAMWDVGVECYLPGTTMSGARNTDPAQLPLDTQAWSVLALPDAVALHPDVLTCAENNHQLVRDGFTGFDFNTDEDGVWFEGTAQMSTAYGWVNQPASAEFYRQELNRAQSTAPFGDGFGIAAASHDGITTGFGFDLFRRIHIGATAWHVFAQAGFNPYYQALSIAPALTGISPNTGSPGALVNVTLTGANFDPSLTIDAGAGVTASNVTVLGPTSATATLAVDVSASLGPRALMVTTLRGTSSAMTFTVVPPVLTVSRIGTGNGTVTTTPAGIDCGAVCSASFPPGQAVALTAIPGPGSVFSGWSGHADCFDGSVTVSASHTCVARFDAPGSSLVGLRAEFNGDGRHDLLLQHADSSTAGWLMNGLSISNGAVLTGPNTGSSLRGLGDFNGDGKSDVVWQHIDGTTTLWLMNGLNVSSAAVLIGAGTGWSVEGIGDFNGDGRSDILWQHVDGSRALWLMNGLTSLNGTLLFGPGTGWSAAQIGDFNGDGKRDILWQHADGSTALWLMDGLTVANGVMLFGPGTGWSAARVGDFNGDGRSDIVLGHPDGSTVLWLMNGLSVINGAVLIGPGTGWSAARIGDFDGDGKGDILLQHTDGSTALWLMDGLTSRNGAILIGPGTGWRLEEVGDFNGDGKSDIIWQHTDGSAAMWLMDGVVVTSGGILFGPGSGWSPAR